MRMGDLITESLEGNEALGEYMASLKAQGIVVNMAFNAAIQVFEAGEHEAQCPLHGDVKLPRMGKKDAERFDRDFLHGMRIKA